MDTFGQVFLWQLKALPDTQEVVVEGTENSCLPGGVRTEALELIWAGGQRGCGSLGSLLKPVIRLPRQELEDPPHLLLEQRYLLLPTGLSRSSLGPFKPELCSSSTAVRT